MTKKEDALGGEEIETDSEPLKFEEASSLFEGENSENKKENHKIETSKSEPRDLNVGTSNEEGTLQNNFREDEIDTIGALLKATRIERNIAIKIISQHTKISVTNLGYLETDQLDLLPNRTYVIGYIKSYAKILQLNQADCLELLDATYGIEKEETQEVSFTTSEIETSRKQPKSQESDANGIKIGVTIAAVAICVFVLVLNNTGQKKQEPVEEIIVIAEKPAPVIAQTLNASTPLKEVTTTKSKPQDVTAEEKVSEFSPVIITKKEIAKEKKEVKKEIAKEKKEAKKEEKLKFRPLASALYRTDSSMNEEKIKTFLPSKYSAEVIEGQHNIFINAYKEDSWLTYKADDGPIKKFVLRKGRFILIRGELVRVFLGNLGAVKVFRNNIPLKISSSSGVKSLVFPQERGNEFMIPLFIYDNKAGTVETSEDYIAREDN